METHNITKRHGYDIAEIGRKEARQDLKRLRGKINFFSRMILSKKVTVVCSSLCQILAAVALDLNIC